MACESYFSCYTVCIKYLGIQKMTERRPRGRPRVAEDRRKLKNFTFRGRSELHEKLRVAAQESGRSVSEEIEQRLSKSFDQSPTPEQIFGTQELYGIMQLLAAAMDETGHITAIYAGLDRDSAAWLHNAFSFGQAKLAAIKILEALQPEGDQNPPRQAGDGRGLGIGPHAAFQAMGASIAELAIREASSGQSRFDSESGKARAGRINRALGAIADRLQVRAGERA
jgi:hypothetical protein